MKSLSISLTLALLTAFSMTGMAGSYELPMDPTSVSVGPFAGATGVTSNTHHYQNAPSGATCIALAQPYTVQVQSSGPVTVSVGSYTTTVNGVGSLSFWSGVCTAFDINVSGQGINAYTIEVVGGPAAGGICNNCIALAS